MTDKPQEIMARAARETINPLDGDSVSVMVHHYWGCDAKTIPEQMKQIDGVFQAITKSQLSALKEVGCEIIAAPSSRFAEAVAAEVLKICGEEVGIEDVACWHKAFVAATTAIQASTHED